MSRNVVRHAVRYRRRQRLRGRMPAGLLKSERSHESCLVANAAALARLNATAGTLPTWTLTSLDGIGCSSTGFPGTDCENACSGGVCVAKNASQGAACMPASDDSGISTIPVSVCSGACDGNGTCVVLNQACESYGRGAIDECLYIACNVAANAPTMDAGAFAPGCTLFPNPSGVQCSDDPCLSGGTCGSQGDCLGGRECQTARSPTSTAAPPSDRLKMGARPMRPPAAGSTRRRATLAPRPRRRVAARRPQNVATRPRLARSSSRWLLAHRCAAAVHIARDKERL